MAGDASAIFRPKSLERLSSPERLDQLLQLADRPSRLPLAALALVVGLFVAWALFGRVPVNVHGVGILVHPRAVLEISSPGSGRLLQLAVVVGDAVRPGQLLGRIALPDLDKQLELQREKVRELTAIARARSILQTQAEATDSPGGDLEHSIDESRRIALSLRRETRDAIADERRIVAGQLERAGTLSAALEARYRSYRELRETGHVSDLEVTDAEAAYLDAETRVADLETRVLELRTRELEVDERLLSRLQALADLRLVLQDYEQQLADARREVATLEARITEQGRIVAETAGTVLEIHLAPGQFVATGQRIGTMAVGESTSPLTAVAYFSVGDGKRVEPGASIQVTPDTVERERYGGITGVVRAVSALPITVDEATKVIGNREIAESIVAGGFRIQVRAELDLDPATPSGLHWSSSRGPEQPLSPGTTATARIAVEHRRPIAFVLPTLKSAAGVD